MGWNYYDRHYGSHRLAELASQCKGAFLVRRRNVIAMTESIASEVVTADGARRNRRERQLLCYWQVWRTIGINLLTGPVEHRSQARDSGQGDVNKIRAAFGQFVDALSKNLRRRNEQNHDCE